MDMRLVLFLSVPLHDYNNLIFALYICPLMICLLCIITTHAEAQRLDEVIQHNLLLGMKTANSVASQSAVPQLSKVSVLHLSQCVCSCSSYNSVQKHEIRVKFELGDEKRWVLAHYSGEPCMLSGN